MPVARIYTRFPEEAAPLIGRLRARGYTIEIVDPGHFRVTPAEMEIQLDRLKTPEALAAAARFGQARDAEVFVAAGLPLEEEAARALRGATAPRGNALLEALQRLIAPLRRLGAEVHEGRKARRQHKIDLEVAREAERKRRAEQKAAGRAERARLQQEERAERERREQQEAERRAAERAAAEARRREEEARVARERAEQLARQREEEQRRRAEQEARWAQAREEEARRRAEESRRAAERDAALAEQRRIEEAERQQRAAEEARQAEARERRRAAEEAARAERERQREADERRRAGEIAALAEAKRRDAEMRRLAAGAPARHASRLGAGVSEKRGERAMKRALVAAACMAVLLTIGWGAYQNRTPASPLTNQQRVRGSGVQQEVPFGAATIPSQPAAAKPAAAPPQAAQKPQPKPAGTAPAKSSPSQRTRRYADDRDAVAEDEVVYHGAPKNTKSRASASQPQPKDGVKRISDLEDDDE